MDFALFDGQGDTFDDRLVADAHFQVLDDELAHCWEGEMKGCNLLPSVQSFATRDGLASSSAEADWEVASVFAGIIQLSLALLVKLADTAWRVGPVLVAGPRLDGEVVRRQAATLHDPGSDWRIRRSKTGAIFGCSFATVCCMRSRV